jgi:hypothetical protein
LLDVKTSWLDRAGTQAGTYEVIGRFGSSSGSGRLLNPGEFSFTVAKSNDAFSYGLTGGAISMTSSSPKIFWSPNLTDGSQISGSELGGKWTQFLGQHLVAYRVHDDGSEEEYMSYDFRRGTSSSSQPGATLTYDVGYSYVAMGEWAWRAVDLAGTPDVDELLFVNGERTPRSAIPVSGKATYDAHALSLLAPAYDSAVPALPITLTADFGQRTIATRIDQDYQHYEDAMSYGDPAIRTTAILGIHVGGSAPFNTDGTWDIPLTGTVNYSGTNALETPPTEPVTGTMDGAFFGPHAEEVGGTFSLDRGDGPPIQDAFVGQQRP